MALNRAEVIAQDHQHPGYSRAHVAHQPTDKCIHFLHVGFAHVFLGNAAKASPPGHHTTAGIYRQNNTVALRASCSAWRRLA
ncbi:hypothetical protein QO004_002005 [Rhizobium mesoamericanum]|nr:hypothetical protein [Rhizobium mesoamericanum]